jgi:hypothetical protein
VAEEKHWGDEGVGIEEISDEEREALMQQAGPIGENARLAWQDYLREHPEEDVAREEETTRQAEMGQTASTVTVTAAGAEESASGEASALCRAEAERRASAMGLEVRDFGTAGDWRLYDPATGRQVAKSKLAGA